MEQTENQIKTYFAAINVWVQPEKKGNVMRINNSSPSLFGRLATPARFNLCRVNFERQS